MTNNIFFLKIPSLVVKTDEIDTIKPSIRIIVPKETSILETNLPATIITQTSDNVSVAKVQIFQNGKLIYEDKTEQFSCDWKTLGNSLKSLFLLRHMIARIINQVHSHISM